jgi:hypothetical protein
VSTRAATAALLLVPLLVLLAAAQEPPPPLPIPPDEAAVARALEQVLADPGVREGLESSHLEAARGEDVLVEGTRRLFEAFQRWAAALAREHPVLNIVLMVGLALALVPLLGHIAWSLGVAFRGPGAHDAAGEGDDGVAARRRRSAELRAEARALADAGRVREASRALLLAFLALLDERGALAVASSWTNREVLARLRVTPEVRARLARFVDAADAACYGSQGPSRAELEAGEALLLELERGAPLRAPA